MAEALELKSQPDLASHVKGIEEDGYAYFPGAMSADQVAELREVMARLTPIEASFNRYSTPDNGGFLNKHINNVFNRDPIFLQYMDGTGVIDLAEAVHGDDCHIIGMTAWVTGPGRPGPAPALRLASRRAPARRARRPASQDARLHHDGPLLPQ